MNKVGSGYDPVKRESGTLEPVKRSIEEDFQWVRTDMDARVVVR